jgi:hypothetical protein
MRVIDRIREQLAWVGPSGRHQDYILLDRDDAKLLLEFIERLQDPSVASAGKMMKQDMAND